MGGSLKLKPGEWGKGECSDYTWVVARMELGFLCGYVKLWKGHPLEALWESEKRPYLSIDIECHGGLTFAKKITKKHTMKRFTPGFWIGWDYAHAGDEILFNILPKLEISTRALSSSLLDYKTKTIATPIHKTGKVIFSGKHWEEEEVITECFNVIRQLMEKYYKPKSLKK